MARSYGKVLSAVWVDRDWAALTREAQYTYMQLLSQPKLTLCGTLDLRPRRLASACANGSEAATWAALRELEAGRYIVIDEDAEELLVRTLVVHDLDPSRLNRNTLKGLWSAWMGIASATLRKVVVDTMPEAAWVKSAAFLPAEAKALRAERPLELPVGTGVPTPDPTGGPGGGGEPVDRTARSNGRSDARSVGPSANGSAPPAGDEHPAHTGSNGRSFDQSDRPVETADSTGRSNPLSPVSCLLSPVSAAADVSREELPPDAETPAAAAHQQAVAQQGPDTLVFAAAKVIAKRRAAHRPDVGEGWVHNAAQGIAADRCPDAEGYLLSLPESAPLPTPDELAEILEPSERPIDFAAERGRRRPEADYQAAQRSRMTEAQEHHRRVLAEVEPPDPERAASLAAAARAALPATSLARAGKTR